MEHIKVKLLDNKGEVQYGLKWGLRENRDPNQAYLQLEPEVYKGDYFPKKGKFFIVNTDDDRTLIMTRAQKDYGCALQTPENNSIIGSYIRERLGVPSGSEISKEAIEAYGKNDIDFYKIDDIHYLMSFSLNSNAFKEYQPRNNRTSNFPLQQIFYGAPGVGKSFTIDDMTDDENSVRTTFHPDSDYASFVGAYKPTMENVPINSIYGESVEFAKGKNGHPGTEKKIVYKYVPQAFLKAYVAAWSNLDTPFYLIIEEINRGNCAQIFGDLFQLLDRNSEGSSSYAIHADEDIAQFLSEDSKGFASLSDEQKNAISAFELNKDIGRTQKVGPDVLSGKLLLLPPNLHIWATMNTSDQSLFPIDSAFKRRWNWKYIPIEYHPIDKKTGRPIDWKFKIGDNLYSWGEFLGKINPEIYSLTESSDKQMGYFFAKAENATGIISEDVFLNKVLFYLWTDVFKDYDVSSELFKNRKLNRSFRFTDFFDKEQPQALADFIANFNLEEIDNDCDSHVENDISRLTVKLPDGSVLNTGNMTDIYVRALEYVGLDSVSEALADRKKGNYPLITKEQIQIENPASKRRYRKSGDYYILVGPDTYPYFEILNEIAELLSIDLHAEFK